MFKPYCPPCLKKIVPAIIVGILLISAAGYFIDQIFRVATESNATDIKGRLATPRTLSDFQLTAHDQKPINIARLKDKWTLLFFGYTHCPDICPTTLTELTQGVQQLPPEVRDDTLVVFVSIDPKRDNPEHLGNYVHYFDERYIGATGELKQLEAFARQLDSKFSHETDPTGAPIVNHSSAILLLDPQVRYYARLSAPHYAENIRDHYLALRNSYSKTTP